MHKTEHHKINSNNVDELSCVENFLLLSIKIMKMGGVI